MGRKLQENESKFKKKVSSSGLLGQMGGAGRAYAGGCRGKWVRNEMTERPVSEDGKKYHQHGEIINGIEEKRKVGDS